MLGLQGQDVTLFNYAAHHGLDFPLNLLADNNGMFTDKFLEWLPKNLHIFADFCSRAKQLKKAGYKRYSADGIMHAIRFETALRSKPEELYKINNDYTAYLSRLAMLAYQELNGFFETRETKAIYK